jgi:hypothetical protein
LFFLRLVRFHFGDELKRFLPDVFWLRCPERLLGLGFSMLLDCTEMRSFAPFAEDVAVFTHATPLQAHDLQLRQCDSLQFTSMIIMEVR